MTIEELNELLALGSVQEEPAEPVQQPRPTPRAATTDVRSDHSEHCPTPVDPPAETADDSFIQSIAAGLQRDTMIQGLRRGYVPNQPPAEPDKAIEWMNKKHFVVSEAGKVVVITEELDPSLKRYVLRRSSFEDVRNLYRNQSVTVAGSGGKVQPKRLGSYWLDHRERRQYQGIVCAPGQSAPGYFNMWRGFSVSPKQGDWTLMDAHIRKNVCGGDAELYHYVRKWLAFAVQHVGQPAEVALVLRGKQGTGKGIFARGFGALFGQHFLHISQARHLAGHFNAHLEDAVVVFADEAFLAGDKQAEGTLKMLVTEPEIVIERKGKDVTRARNVIHLIIASNNDLVISAAPEERRFCVLDVADTHAQDHDYFAAIVEQMNHGGREAMLHDLLNDNLADFNIRKVPQTDALHDQKFGSMTPVEKWWFQKLSDGHLLNDEEHWTTEVARDELLTGYNFSTRQNCTAQELRNQLVKVLPEGYPKDGPRRGGGSDRKRTWVVPALGKCRAHFDKLFKTDHAWPEDSSGEP